MVDEEGNEVPAGTIGHLAVQGPTGCRYLDDTRQRLRPQRLEPHRRLLSRRRGRLLLVPGAHRRHDHLARATTSSGPEVEGVLLDHPAVAECGVVGAPDEERGQIVKAYVVPRAGAPGQELTRSCRIS